MKLALLAAAGVAADRPQDLITSLPGFPNADTWGFKAYSGRLEVPGPILGYDKLLIHYQFHTSKRDSAKDPVVAWHQGGPGCSSITIGEYGEMGALIVGDDKHGNYVNPHAWNNVANMLYLESPAGSDDFLARGPNGYSECISNGRAQTCRFDDRTQAEAYAHTLTVFFKEFSEFAQHDFFLTGESYFGQFGPNIAHYILNTEPFASSIKFRGLAAGNACWGGTATRVECNGPNEQRNLVELYSGNALVSNKLHKQILKACNFEQGNFSASSSCQTLLRQMSSEIGPHNPYNLYDNCPATQEFLHRTGKDMDWLLKELRDGMHRPHFTRSKLMDINGGFEWDCLGDVGGWIQRSDVKKALHLDGVRAGASRLSYSSSGPASITLYPELVKKIHVMIYNGDKDPCVPYNGNEEWISELESRGTLQEKEAWSPWFTKNKASPAGYVTKYSVPGSEQPFSFRTVRLAGHMVPQFMPEAALTMFTAFIDTPLPEWTMPSAVV